MQPPQNKKFNLKNILDYFKNIIKYILGVKNKVLLNIIYKNNSTNGRR